MSNFEKDAKNMTGTVAKEGYEEIGRASCRERV